MMCVGYGCTRVECRHANLKHKPLGNYPNQAWSLNLYHKSRDKDLRSGWQTWGSHTAGWRWVGGPTGVSGYGWLQTELCDKQRSKERREGHAHPCRIRGKTSDCCVGHGHNGFVSPQIQLLQLFWSTLLRVHLNNWQCGHRVGRTRLIDSPKVICSAPKNTRTQLVPGR